MTRRSCWPSVAAVSLSVAILIFVGCQGRDDGPTRGVDAVSTKPTASDAAPSRPATRGSGGSAGQAYRDWPTPAAALVITGQTHGYLEPCGCAEGQKGGLARRYHLVESLRETGWPLAALDLGSLVKDPANARGGFEQAKIKFDIALRALEMMRYDAVALSAEDLKLGVTEVLAQYLNLNDHLRIVSANVKPIEGLDEAVARAVRVEAGPMTIGVTAVLDPQELAHLTDPDKDDLLDVRDPSETLSQVLSELEADTDLQVLLVQGPSEMAQDLARTYPGFDIVVATSDFPDPPAEPEWVNDGATMVVTVGQKGMYVGLVGLFPNAPPDQKFRYQRVTLSDRFPMAGPVRKLIDEDFQAELKLARVVEDFPKRAYVQGASAGATFVGAETCKECHPNTYALWEGSHHARGYESIAAQGRSYDAECVTCHTTGFEYTSGWVSAELTSHLKGNQCENCHGPGSKHVAEPDHPDYRQAMALTADYARTNLCIRCHDEDNSPKFHFETYWGKIVHKGMDRYDDPKVHQGIDPETLTRPTEAE